MDKGLQEIKALQIKLSELETKKSKNDIMLEGLNASLPINDAYVHSLKNGLEKLENTKEEIEGAPEEYKKDKKLLIKLFSIVALISNVVLLLLGILTFTTMAGFLNYIMQLLTFSVIVYPAVAAIIIKLHKPKYEFDKLEEIQRQINEKTTELESASKKIQNILTRRKNCTDLKNELDEKVNEITEKISSINKLRTDVIEEYCKENLELDNLLNTAYEEKIQKKAKQKTKNSN